MSRRPSQDDPSTAATDLLASLRDGCAAERLEAVQQVRETLGGEALEPLCAALRDVRLPVRVVAAMELGMLGDARAIPSLREALRRSMYGGSASQHIRNNLSFVALWAFFWVLASTWILIHFPVWVGGMGALILGFLTRPGKYLTRSRRESRFAAAVAVALARITEQQVTPDVLGVTEELRILAGDRLHQEGMARELIRKAAERIEEATSDFRNLPLVSAPVAAGVEAQLPRVAEAPIGDPERLPRV